MAFGKTTGLKMGFALGFLAILLTVKPVLCRGQAEPNPDDFGGSYRRPAGDSGMKGKPGPVHDVISWATFTDAAEESGMSQRYGGIHVEDAIEGRRLLGRRVGALCWNKIQTYISGIESEKRLPTPAQKETDVVGW